MARRGSRGDRVLESRHLIGLFVGVVILCAVFFTLGYVMGRAHYASSVQAFGPDRGVVSAVDRETGRERVQPKEETPAPAGEWDFYANQSNNKLEKPAPAPAPKNSMSEKPLVAANQPAPALPVISAPRASTRPVRMTSPKMNANAVLLQVAAVTHQGDALAMADALQRKKFPSFVTAPSTDGFYRVQVGPYPDERAAENARSALDRAGFKAIIKH